MDCESIAVRSPVPIATGASRLLVGGATVSNGTANPIAGWTPPCDPPIDDTRIPRLAAP